MWTREIHAEVEIDAPPSAVWDVLGDLDAYPAWNPHIVRAEGTLEPGERVNITVQPSGWRAREIAVTVTDVVAGEAFEWTGHVVASVLYEATHRFELHELDGGKRTRFVNHEDVSGLLVPVVLSEETDRDYAAMNDALRERVEARQR